MIVNINEIKVKAGWSKRISGNFLLIEQDEKYKLFTAMSGLYFIAGIHIDADTGAQSVDIDAFRCGLTKALLSEAIEVKVTP